MKSTKLGFISFPCILLAIILYRAYLEALKGNNDDCVTISNTTTISIIIHFLFLNIFSLHFFLNFS